MSLCSSIRWNLFVLMSAIYVGLKCPISGHQISEFEADSLNKSGRIIPKNYIKHTLPPTVNGKPINVNFSIRVFIIRSVNNDDMDFSFDMYLQQEWEDLRVTVPKEIFWHEDDYVALPIRIFTNLWKPDLYFLNTKVEDKNQKFSSVTLFKNKTIRMVTRVHAVLACQMEFQYYPMDIQICPVAIESFLYNNKRMMLRWSGKGVVLSTDVKHLQYNILPIHLEQTTMFKEDKNDNFSRLIVYFAFERQIGHAVIQVFAPSTLIVVLSWFSFWLDLDAIPGRVTLLVTCLLSLVTMFTNLRIETPVVDYVKALDIWIAGCLFSVFGAVAEFVIAKVLFVKYTEMKKDEAWMQNQRISTASEFLDPNSTEYLQNFQYKNSSRNGSLVRIYWKTPAGKEKVMWHECDKLSRALFPIFFFIFAVIYWTVLIYSRQHYRKSVTYLLD